MSSRISVRRQWMTRPATMAIRPPATARAAQALERPGETARTPKAPAAARTANTSSETAAVRADLSRSLTRASALVKSDGVIGRNLVLYIVRLGHKLEFDRVTYPKSGIGYRKPSIPTLRRASENAAVNEPSP